MIPSFGTQVDPSLCRYGPLGYRDSVFWAVLSLAIIAASGVHAPTFALSHDYMTPPCDPLPKDLGVLSQSRRVAAFCASERSRVWTHGFRPKRKGHAGHLRAVQSATSWDEPAQQSRHRRRMPRSGLMRL